MRHGEAVALVSRRPVSGGEALSFYDDLVRTLLRHHVPVERVLVLVGALDFLVLGSAAETFTAGFDRPAQAYAAKQPQLAEALAAATLATVDDEAFDLALEAWLDIVAMSRTARDAS